MKYTVIGTDTYGNLVQEEIEYAPLPVVPWWKRACDRVCDAPSAPSIKPSARSTGAPAELLEMLRGDGPETAARGDEKHKT